MRALVLDILFGLAADLLAGDIAGSGERGKKLDDF
jgi:hypothetical protein